MCEDEQIIDGKEYVFLTNYKIKYERHMLAVLDLCKIEDYKLLEAIDLFGNRLDDSQEALWITKNDEDKIELYFQTSLVLRSRLKKTLIEKNYDVRSMNLDEIYIGMDIKSLKKRS